MDAGKSILILTDSILNRLDSLLMDVVLNGLYSRVAVGTDYIYHLIHAFLTQLLAGCLFRKLMLNC